MDSPRCFSVNSDVFATDFDPIIRLRVYRRRDITALATDTAETLDLGREVVLLQPVAETYLEDVNTSPELAICLAEHEESYSVEKLQPTDFISSPLRVENVVVAASLCLWRNIRRTNDIVEAARDRFLRGVEVKRRTKKSKLLLRRFLRFLNELFVDVVVLSTDRRSVVVSCANTAHRSSIHTVASMRRRSCPSFRTLIALEFNPSEGYWSPLLLPVRLQTQRSMMQPSKTPDNQDFNDVTNFRRTRALTVTCGEMTQSFNLETMMLDRTVYNPQRVPVRLRGDMQTVRGENDGESAPANSPFTGMRYPNIRQLDLQVMEVLRRGLHPALRCNCIRFLVTFAVALAAFAAGLALIIYVRFTLETRCCRVSDGICLVGAGDASENVKSNPFCDVKKNPALLKATEAFLFSHLASPGGFIVASTSCMFMASLLAVAVSYFTTRAAALENSRPLFYIVMMALHIVVNAIASAFAAYTLYIFSHTTHEVPCSSFKGDTAVFCSAAQELCPDYAIKVQARHPVHATIALSAVFFSLCVVEFFASFISSMPDEKKLQTISKAKPETNVFYPSVYAPDGVGEMEKRKLRKHIAHRLRKQLQEQMQQQDVLLTRNATIGEMILAKREKTLMGDLSNGNCIINARDWNDEELQDPLHYMIAPGGTSSENDMAKEEKQKMSDTNKEDWQLPSCLLEEVARISSRIQASTSGKTTLVSPNELAR
ncbi:hypothetical protein TraAM80_00934 [Trypanosoma rangeli]|uniref:Uncharacterized protein n=1 Tax=Trypanosoma rangeli TaxID=5698 RepID=A0A3R7N1X0_TRYRA|nr:uncharacterized protein TraAM80_00934 [Trypanosoma rangeli]RNF11488.1 hypothetical protein TraAM80_00934 [Trypanosoma rangeli]|eukprot:RNF11488.1 hypothetical protein TraAM80_00934 [Trypanosoma rangeli]